MWQELPQMVDALDTCPTVELDAKSSLCRTAERTKQKYDVSCAQFYEDEITPPLESAKTHLLACLGCGKIWKKSEVYETSREKFFGTPKKIACCRKEDIISSSL